MTFNNLKIENLNNLKIENLKIENIFLQYDIFIRKFNNNI